MPELAECKTFVTALQTEYGDQTLNNLSIVGGRFLKEGIPGLAELTFPLTHSKFQSKGKFLYFTFLTPEQKLTHFFVTLGMAASFGKQQKHSAVKFSFDNGDVYYNDIRHFGTIKVNQSPEQLTEKLNTLGWDCLEEPNIPDYLVPRIREKNHKTIAEVLLDQYCLSGLGNWMRSEILYATRINPFRKVSELSDDDLMSIAQSYRSIAKDAYDKGGATIATFFGLYGEAGRYNKEFKVYSKRQDPDGKQVIKVPDKNGRTIHYVPEVQSLI